MAAPLLEISNLSVEFRHPPAARSARSTASTSRVEPGEVLGIVGESGSGKSVAMLAVMGLIAWPGQVTRRRAALRRPATCSRLSTRQRRELVGKDIAMIFQEPMSCLNPCFTVGFQITETLAVHRGLAARQRRASARSSCSSWSASPPPQTRLAAFPHQLSGGMSQRVMIAMAIACNPKLLIADEPTTALDVTIQAQILDLLLDLQRDRGMALILITHDMGVVAETRDRVWCCMPASRSRTQPVPALFERPAPSLHRGAAGGAARARRGAERLPTHPRRGAGQSRPAARLPVQPRCASSPSACRAEQPALDAMPARRACAAIYPLIGGRAGDARRPRRERAAAARARAAAGGAGPARHYRVGARPVQAGRHRAGARGVSFTLDAGRTLAVVGESGCGKSTLARMVTLIEPPTAGTLVIDGTDAVGADAAASCARCAARCRSCSRTPTARSTRARRSAHILEEPLAHQHRRARPPSAREAVRAMMRRWACGRSMRSATRTCSPAASASASRSRAR